MMGSKVPATNWKLAIPHGPKSASPKHYPLTPEFSKEGVPRMRRSFFRHWLRNGPAAVTMVALGFGFTAHAKERDASHPPKKLPIALLSNDGADERAQINIEPAV